MYMHPGKEIKINAGILTILWSIPDVLIGISVILLSYSLDGILHETGLIHFIGWVLGIVIIVVGVWIARIHGSMMYGFGIIVDRFEHMKAEYFSDNITYIDDLGEEEYKEEPVFKENKKKPASPTQPWECPFCGHKNSAKAKKCQNPDCGIDYGIWDLT